MKINKRFLFIFLIFFLGTSFFAEGYGWVGDVLPYSSNPSFKALCEDARHMVEQMEKQNFNIQRVTKLTKNQEALLWDAIERYDYKKDEAYIVMFNDFELLCYNRIHFQLFAVYAKITGIRTCDFVTFMTCDCRSPYKLK